MILDRTNAPEIRQIQSLSIARPEKRLLPNGIPLNILNAGTEDVVRFDILFEGGRLHQTQPMQAVLTNRMLREGTRTLASSEIAEQMDYYGAWLDFSSSIKYGYVSLYSLNKYFPQTIRILASMIQDSVFPEKELNTVVKTFKQRIQVNNERVDFLSQKQLKRSLFGPRHPMGKTAEMEDCDRINAEVLREFYDRYYQSNNCSIYIAGKVNADILSAVEDVFGTDTWGNGHPIPQLPSFVAEPDTAKRFFIEKEDAMQSSLRIGGFTLPRKHPDYLKFRVLVTLFGGYFGSRLMSNIREEKGYTYGIGAGIASYPGCGMLVVSTETGNEYIERVVDEVYREMDRLQQEKVSEEELTMVKNYMLGDMCRSYESAFSLSDAWIYIQSEELDADYYTHAVDAIREVTADEIRELAQSYFCKENLIEVVAGKKV